LSRPRVVGSVDGAELVADDVQAMLAVAERLVVEDEDRTSARSLVITSRAKLGRDEAMSAARMITASPAVR
jgi:hypothetical protein